MARALREIVCLERTLFMLGWISDPALRHRSNAGLKKGEARNALARALFFHRHGEIRAINAVHRMDAESAPKRVAHDRPDSSNG